MSISWGRCHWRVMLWISPHGLRLWVRHWSIACPQHQCDCFTALHTSMSLGNMHLTVRVVRVDVRITTHEIPGGISRIPPNGNQWSRQPGGKSIRLHHESSMSYHAIRLTPVADDVRFCSESPVSPVNERASANLRDLLHSPAPLSSFPFTAYSTTRPIVIPSSCGLSVNRS